MPTSRRSVPARGLAVVLASLATICYAGFAASEPSAGETSSLHIGPLQVGRILYLGNSITLHGPAENIGWSGNWGMAATSLDKDYVHLLTSRIAKAAGGEPKIEVQNVADFERGYATWNVNEGLKKQLEFDADLVIVAIGENVPPLATDEDKSAFKSALTRLIQAIQERKPQTIVVRSSFWADDAKDTQLKAVSAELGCIFVNMGDAGRDEANYARSERKIEHAGVAAHPGDRGMQTIADGLWKALEPRMK